MGHEVSAFEREILPHLDAAFNLARWLMRDPAAAEDVVQDAMLRALRFHDGRRGEAKPWLLQIVRNAAYAALAGQIRRAEIPLEPDEALGEPDPADDPEAALMRRQDRRHLDRAVAALPEELRECLVLKELEDMSYKEIAAITGVPIGTVMSRLWRARKLLIGSAT